MNSDTAQMIAATLLFIIFIISPHLIAKLWEREAIRRALNGK